MGEFAASEWERLPHVRQANWTPKSSLVSHQSFRRKAALGYQVIKRDEDI